MSEPKLKAKLWVHATIRRCALINVPAVVVRKGDDDAGTVLVKLNRGADGCEVFTQVRDGEGRLAWMRGTGPVPVPEDRADAYVARQREVDWDLWVIEVEDRQGRLPFDEPVLPG